MNPFLISALALPLLSFAHGEANKPDHLTLAKLLPHERVTMSATLLPIPYEVTLRARYNAKCVWESLRFAALLIQGIASKWTKEEWVYAATVRLNHEEHLATVEHAKRTERLMEKFGIYLGWKYTEIRDGKLAAGIHDFGKLFIPDAILKKKGPLEDDELAIMRMHVLWSERCLRFMPGFKRLVHIVGNHHERFDGKGYPRGLYGDQISKVTHALAIVDAFDAITQPRYYSREKTVEWAFWELQRCAGAQFDPFLVDRFCAFMSAGYVPQFVEPRMYHSLMQIAA